VVIPNMALKQAIDAAAFKLGIKVKGRGPTTYKNFFASGLLIESDVPIRNGKDFLTPDDAEKVTISCNPLGVRGGGKRVTRRFPVFHGWHGIVPVLVIDDILVPEIVEQHVRAAGMVVGIGRFRPQNGGVNGRFRLVEAKWEDAKF
jgi:hypothetical protein